MKLIKNIHHNEIISYNISLKNCEIVFNTIDSDNELVNIIFRETIINQKIVTRK